MDAIHCVWQQERIPARRQCAAASSAFRIARHLPRVVRSQPHQPARRAHLCLAIPRRAFPVELQVAVLAPGTHRDLKLLLRHEFRPAGGLSDVWGSGRKPRTSDNRLELSMMFHEHPRVAVTNSVCNSGRDSTRPPGPATDRYGDLHRSRFVRPFAGCATLISIDEPRGRRAERSSRRRRRERRRVPQLAASNGGARPRQPVPVRRRGRSVCCGGLGRRWDAPSGVDQAPRRNGE